MSVSQADRIRVQIEDEILAFTFKPGDRLDECKLAERYGTSRTPVREALRQLSSNGLVEIRPHKGAIVARMGIQEVVEVFEVLAELEGACGRLAAKGCMKSDLDAIAVALAECGAAAEAKDLAAYAIGNTNFHTAIAQASHNSYLIRLTSRARNRVMPFQRLQLEPLNRISKSYIEHEAIYKAIEDGQPDEADRLIYAHSLNRGADIPRFISALSPSENGTVDPSIYEAVSPK